MNTVHVVVRGIVQGVGFRAFTVRAAQRHGVRGWVRNLPDGTVEIAAQGAPESFFEDLALGPRHGRVDTLERASRDEPEYRGFDVLR